MLTCSKVKVGPLLRKDLPDDIVARRGRLRWIISDAQVDIDSSSDAPLFDNECSSSPRTAPVDPVGDSTVFDLEPPPMPKPALAAVAREWFWHLCWKM